MASLAVAVATGCAGGADEGATETTGSPGGDIEHPTGLNQLVLGVEVEGGFAPIEFTMTRMPGFSLYGDGTAITPGARTEIDPQPALPPIVATPISEDGVQRILQEAVAAGLTKGADYTDLDGVEIADASTTVFTLSAAGQTTTTRVYALTELTERPSLMSREEFEARQLLKDLQERLRSLRSWLPDGSAGDDRPYTLTAVRLFVRPYESDPELKEQPVEWPVPETRFATFGEPAGQGWKCGTVSGAALSVLLLPALREANQLTLWVSGGERYSILFRPLLPDESGC